MLHTSPVAITDERQKTIAISTLGLPDRLKLFENCQKHDYVSPAIDVLFYRRLVSYYDYYIKITFYKTPRRTKTDTRAEFDIFTASIFISDNGIGKRKFENVIKLVKE